MNNPAGGYHCSICNEWHDELPLAYGAPAPDAWYAIPEDEVEERAVLSADQCIIDDEYFFVLGNIELPIIGSDNVFHWTVWVSLSETNFERMTDLWETPGRESEPPYFGWLNTALPTYPDTIELKTMVHTQPVGERPLIEVEPTDHPLAVEQREGITWERVRAIADVLLHDE